MVCDERKYAIADDGIETGIDGKDERSEGVDERDVPGAVEVDGAEVVGASKVGLETVNEMY